MNRRNFLKRLGAVACAAVLPKGDPEWMRGPAIDPCMVIVGEPGPECVQIPTESYVCAMDNLGISALQVARQMNELGCKLSEINAAPNRSVLMFDDWGICESITVEIGRHEYQQEGI